MCCPTTGRRRTAAECVTFSTCSRPPAAWRAVDLETGIKSTLDATTIDTPFGITIADAKKAGFKVVETREVAFMERYDWSQDFSGPVRKKPLDFLVRDVAVSAMQGRV